MRTNCFVLFIIDLQLIFWVIFPISLILVINQIIKEKRGDDNRRYCELENKDTRDSWRDLWTIFSNFLAIGYLMDD